MSTATPEMEAAALRRARLAVDGGAYVELRAAEDVEREISSAVRRNGSAPLSGWTLAVKDLIAVAGHRVEAGSAARRDADAEHSDAPIVAILKRLGAVVVGTTALHELAFGVTGVNPHAGTPRNPREPDCIPGGSSSGSAVAVAEGSARVALGTDTGGSVRIPAALCGVVGFKPAIGTYPMAGVLPLAPTLDHLGLLARSVADVCAVHSACKNGIRPLPRTPRIGLLKAEMDAAEPGVASRLEVALDLLAREGATIAEATWPEPERVFAASTTIMFAEAARVHGRVLESTPHLLGSDVRARLEAGAAIEPAALTESRRERRRLQEIASLAFAEFDCVISPTVGTFAPTITDATDPEVGRRLVANTRLANLAGFPAISLPVPGDGPAVGLQVAALTDHATLAAAEWMERTIAAGCLECREPDGA